MKKILLSAFLIGTLSCFLTPVLSQVQYEEGLEYLLFMEVPEVTTATLTKKASLKAPSTMTVITQEELKNIQPKNLIDLLEKVAGIRINHEFFGRKIITLRGTTASISNDKFKLLVNGHAISEPVYGSFSDWFNINLENVKQVEIVRGPGSALYGTNAFAGIINIITKSPSAINGTEIAVTGGSFDTKKIDLVYGKGNENVEWGASFNYTDTEGTDEKIKADGLTGTPLSIAPQDMDESEKSYSGSVFLKYNNFKIRGSYLDNEIGLPVPQLTYLTEDGETKEFKHGYVEAEYNFSITDSFSILTKVSYDKFQLDDEAQLFPDNFVIPYDLDGDGNIEYWPNGAFGLFGYESDSYKGEVLFDFKLSENNQLLIGVFGEKIETSNVYLKSNVHPLYLFELSSITDLSDSFNWNKEEEREIFGVFFQDEIQITPALYLIIGGRYDDYSDFGSSFNPRTGLVWNFNQQGGILKAIYGTAFKAPTFAQLYNQNNPSLVGNTDLDAESLKSYEISIGNIFFNQLHVNLAVYYNKTEDLIDLSSERDFSRPLAPAFYVNSGETKAYGYELDTKFVFKEDSYLYGSLHYTKAEDEITGEDLPLIPNYQGLLGFNIHFMENLNWNIQLDYTGEMEREAGDPRKDVDATTVVDTTFGIENIHGWNFYFNVYNLFDEEVVSPTVSADLPLADLPLPGRNYTVKASVKF